MLFLGVAVLFSVSDVSATSFTPDEISSASTTVQNQIETTKTLPNNVTIGTQTVNTAQYLHLATQATTQIKNNNNTAIKLQNDKTPTYQEEQLKTGTLNQANYLDFANRIDNHMDNNQEAPPYGLIAQGKISYQSQVYLYSRILSIYDTTGTLPSTITVKAWSTSNIPIQEPTPYTITQILETSNNLKKYIETNKKLPNTITIGNNNINMAQFLYLATKATVALNNGQSTTSTITVASYTLPGNSYENLKTGGLSTGTYVDFANRIAQHIAENYHAPPYGITGLGQINYQSQIYFYSRVLSSYKSNGQLPNTMTVKTWTTSNIPINEPASYTFTINQILTAAQNVKTYIETNKKLPSTVTIGTHNINMAQFLFLAVAATNDLNKGNPTTNTVTVNSYYQLPSSSTENLKTGTLKTSTYVDFANRIAQYMAENYQAPPYGLIGLGQISYQSQTYLYSRVLSSYKNNGQLPSTMTLKAWTSTNIPINEPTSYTINQILETANSLKTIIENTKTMPATVSIGTSTLNMTEFLYLATEATVALNKGQSVTTTITVGGCSPPGSCSEELSSELLSQADYVDLAKRISEFIENNLIAPEYGLSAIGKIGYQSQIYTYSRVLAYYKTNQKLPVNIIIKKWSTANIPTTGINLCFTINEIAAATTDVQEYIDTNYHLPISVEVAGVTVNVAQYLHLLTTAIVQINNNNKNVEIALQNDLLPGYIEEQLKSGTICKSEYVDFAQRINSYINENKQIPPYGWIGLGKISYPSQIYLFNKILNSYLTCHVLPVSADVKPLSLYKPVWITSDNINTNAVDMERMNDIVEALRTWGVNAYVYGLGPNTHYSVLQSSSVPQNALVVNLYGGACAGTIYEMGANYYYAIKGSREVYSIWISPPAWNITNLPTKTYNNGVNFLPKAWDDDFSNYLPDWGYNTKGQWLCGLNNPDQFLNNRGYNFLITTGSILEMANAIYNEART
ncbi:pseudomurein-binding repeat-containing protein [Methanobacterium ferruginis]|uniref:pseudomurein-binding repeat-containing protein n=1 Tax=Methanobacterium ferruginis TaxID=710191 RepID=UPI00257251F8|nr:pseudomurein-binding repeat-containing protein [Methanobacterium ferruginis]